MLLRCSIVTGSTALGGKCLHNFGWTGQNEVKNSILVASHETNQNITMPNRNYFKCSLKETTKVLFTYFEVHLEISLQIKTQVLCYTNTLKAFLTSISTGGRGKIDQISEYEITSWTL